MPAEANVSSDGLPRQVVRRAAIDLKSDDVRGVYIKLQTLLPLEGEGEYVEAAQINGTGRQLDAYVTLRVRGERLPQVIAQLRSFAEVLKEQTDASDVTAQIVDTDARIRNEKRVEAELLELLEKRKDAPLKDIMEVSNSLAQVRGRIEQMTAQQQVLSRQVALASIVISVHAKDAPVPPPPQQGFAVQAARQFKLAWRSGLETLVTSAAAIVQVVLGGLVFWIGLIVVLVLLRRWYLRSTRPTP